MNLKLHPKIKYLLWLCIAFSVGISSAFFITKAIGYYKIDSKTAYQNVENTNTITEDNTPKNFYFIKDPNQKPKISANAYVVGDLDTGEIILEKNENDIFPIASVSKLMTSLIGTELSKDEDIAQVTKNALATYGKNGELHLGEKIKVNELFYPLLMESSNDAAEVIAEYFNRDSFISKMNLEAKKLEMNATSFEDPSGLSPNNKSTALDLFKLSGYLVKNKENILEITKKKSYLNAKHNWFSTNQFLREEGYLGGKSGYTDLAKQTGISLFSIPLGESGTRHIAITLLQTPDRYKDAKSLLTYLRKNVYYGGEDDANTAWVKEKEGLPDIEEKDFVTLAFVGDIMLDRGVRSSVNKNFNGDYSALFDNLDILKNYDISFANLEGPASDQGKDMHNLYSFEMDPSAIPAIKGAGFDILSVANNHVGDYGRDAYIDTLARLKENEILYAGGGNNSTEAEQPTIIEKYGMKIGYLAFSDKGPDWMQATSEKAGLLLANNPRFDEIISNASKQVDYLIVSFHFGEEYQTKHNDRQAYLAHKAIDAGAKIIIGAHPHVVEDTEVYKKGFIAYSLGNFIFDQKFSENTMQGMLLELKLNRDGSISAKKNIIKLDSVFQPQKPILGKEEKVKF
ncbi:CapA family protein [Candidatus Nomurabacteria bacterium]|nr:CapA family protein [Candidatus Nomurabacteria bacterium]